MLSSLAHSTMWPLHAIDTNSSTNAIEMHRIVFVCANAQVDGNTSIHADEKLYQCNIVFTLFRCEKVESFSSSYYHKRSNFILIRKRFLFR